MDYNTTPTPDLVVGPDSVQILIIFLVVVFIVLILFLLIYYYVVKGLPSDSTGQTSPSTNDPERGGNPSGQPERQSAMESVKVTSTTASNETVAKVSQKSQPISTGTSRSSQSVAVVSTGQKSSQAAPTGQVTGFNEIVLTKKSASAGKKQNNKTSDMNTGTQEHRFHTVVGTLANLRETLKETERSLKGHVN